MSISRVVCGGGRLRDSISHILTGVWTSGGHHITHCLIHHCWCLGLVNNTTCGEETHTLKQEIVPSKICLLQILSSVLPPLKQAVCIMNTMTEIQCVY